jgi:hypothetical protein
LACRVGESRSDIREGAANGSHQPFPITRRPAYSSSPHDLHRVSIWAGVSRVSAHVPFPARRTLRYSPCILPQSQSYYREYAMLLSIQLFSNEIPCWSVSCIVSRIVVFIALICLGDTGLGGYFSLCVPLSFSPLYSPSDRLSTFSSH